MRCPHCGTVEDKVVESRTLANGDAIRRRRECISCGYSEAPPTACPKCGSINAGYRGEKGRTGRNAAALQNRNDRHSARHSNGRQRIELSRSAPCRRRIRRHGPSPARLPRRRAHLFIDCSGCRVRRALLPRRQSYCSNAKDGRPCHHPLLRP